MQLPSWGPLAFPLYRNAPARKVHFDKEEEDETNMQLPNKKSIILKFLLKFSLWFILLLWLYYYLTPPPVNHPWLLYV